VARRAAETAAKLDDKDLAALARDLGATIRSLSDGTLTRGDALDRLKALAEEADRAAGETERRRDAMHAAGRALEDTPSTRAMGEALSADDAAAAEKALGALGARAAEASAAERGQLARALDAAGARAESAAALAAGERDPAAADGKQQQQRRLQHDKPPPASAPPAQNGTPAAQDRRLQRLRRDLADAAAACRENPEACRSLPQRAGDLPRMAREAGSLDALRRLENSARQMRERLRRGDLGGNEGARRSAERNFMRAARGQRGQSGQGTEGERGTEGQRGSSGSGDGEEYEETLAEDEAAAGMDTGGQGQGEDGAESGAAQTPAAGAAQATGGNGDGNGQGDGIGNQPGGNALGAAGQQGRARGQEREARLRGGAGPTRSQVIEAAAQRGFAHGAYDRVFTDYQAVVEEALEAGAVPEGRRYVVRRYFQLIRPRSETKR
jgi:hypothetical protein